MRRVLGRQRRMDDGRIEGRAGRNPDAVRLQVEVHRIEHSAAQIVLFDQMAEAAYGRLVRRRSRAKVHADEPLQHRRFIQRLFHTGIGQVEPLLHEVSPQHNLETHRTTSVARLRVMRLS